MLIIDIQYLPSIIWFKNSIQYKYIKIEQCERWQKMSFRNRCTILGANGIMDLTVPIRGGRNSGEMIRNVQIDNLQKWQYNHWKKITLAYNRSPWFEFYKDELEGLFKIKFEFLWDWNITLLEWIVKKLNLELPFGFTEFYQKIYDDVGTVDLRNTILPRTLAGFSDQCPGYHQVFEARFGFIPNLSIIDLLFCEGNNAASLLKGTP
jgi:hypothetical protein